MEIQTKEALITEINNFKKEALKMHIVEVLANTYEHSSLFDCNIDVDGSVIWYKAQARQLWDFWKAAKAQAVPEGFVLLPLEPTQAIKTALSYQCFDFIKVAQIYRDHGFDIPKKAENEQSFFLHKFLLLAIKHGDDFIKIFNAETKAMIEAQEQSHD